MSRITNKLQLSNELKNSYNVAKASGTCSNSTKSNALKQISASSRSTIASECNKPLQSNYVPYVNSKVGKASSIDLGYNSDRHYGVYRAVGNLWLCRDRQVKPKLSECEKEQWRLYRQLKREYEIEKKLLRGEVVDESTVTMEEKARARARKISYFLNKEHYDRIYKAV